MAGFGAFILVRRAALERSAGFQSLRMEIADDLGIGLVVKEAGGRLAVVRALDHVTLRFYESVSDMRRSLEKGGYGIIGRHVASLGAPLLIALEMTLGVALLLAWRARLAGLIAALMLVGFIAVEAYGMSIGRTESCGCHFREESQTAEGEAKRDDDNFAYVAAWEFKGADKEPELHKEQLVFETVKLTQRSYK